MYIKIGKGLLCPRYDSATVKITTNKADAIYLSPDNAVACIKRLKDDFGLIATMVCDWEVDD